MADIYVKSGGGTKNAGDYRGIWTTAGNWAVGDRVVAVNVVSYRVHECTTAGAGDASEPTWNTTTDATTTMAAGAVFTTRIPSTWANATVDLTRVAANDAAGDVIYISQSHAETTAANVSIALASTNALPVKIICGNDAAAPPTAVATSATVTTTGFSSITFSGHGFYVYGVQFNLGTGANSPALSLCSTSYSTPTYENCLFNIVSTSLSRITVAGQFTYLTLKNCEFKCGSAQNYIENDTSSGTRLYWDGGGLAAGTTSPTFLIENGNSWASLTGLNLSAGGSGMHIFKQPASIPSFGVIRNSKLPASWTGSLVTGTLVKGDRYEMFNCDSADTNYRLQISSYAGAITSETTVVRTGGASDGTTTISWKMVSTANAEYPHITLDTPEIVRWQETTGSAITVTVEIITDNVTLTDAECWLEVQYLGTSGFPLGSFISDAKADVLATVANQTTSTETWTTTGLTTPVKQKLVSPSFTPQEKGYVHAVVKLAKASTTVYVDPELTVP